MPTTFRGSGVWTMAVAFSMWLAAGLQADTAILGSGKEIRGQLKWHSGRLVFLAPAQPTLQLHQVAQVRLGAARVVPLRAVAIFRLLLTDGRRLTGELLRLDRETVRFCPAWAPPLTVPRFAVAGVIQAPGFLTFWDEDFENTLRSWKVAGKARLSDRQHASGKQALLLDAPGQSAEYTLTHPLAVGRLGVNFFDPNNTSASRWLVEAEFRSARGPRTVRAIVADDAGSYFALVPQADQKPFSVQRSAGWHRLVMEFNPRTLVITVDDDLLWVSRRQGPGGPLQKIRLSCVAAALKHRGQVFFDDLSLAQAVDPLDHQLADPEQDELWLRDGDQLLGNILGADRHAIDLQARFAKRSWPWGDVRGIFLRRQPSPLRITQGEHVTVWLRTGAGPEPDRLAGQVRALDERHLTLDDPVLGKMAIDRTRVSKIRWEFHGRLMVLDESSHHLGPKGRWAAGLRPVRAEGLTLRRHFRLHGVPAAARLRVEVVHLKGPEDDDMAGSLRRGERRTEVVVNGQVVDYLNRHVRRSSGQPRWLLVSLPTQALRAGDNTLVIRQTPEKSGHYESCGLTGLVIEVPE